MTIANEIRRIKTNIQNAYAEAEEKGATLPVEKNSDNLASAISTIQGGGGDKVLAQTTEASVTGAEGEKVFLQPVAKNLKPEAYPLVDYMVTGSYLVWENVFKTIYNHIAWVGPIRMYNGAGSNFKSYPYEYTTEGSFALRSDFPISGSSYGDQYPDSEKGISICSNYTIAYNDKTKEITKKTGGIGFTPYTYSSRWYGDYLLVYLQGGTVNDSGGNPYNVVVCKYSEDAETGVKSLPIIHKIYIESLGAITQTSYFGLISETDPIICVPQIGTRYYNFYKIDLENGSFIEYTTIELKDTGVSSSYPQHVCHFAGNLLVLGDSSYKVSFDDVNLTVNVEDSIPSRKCPIMIRGYKCAKTYLYNFTTPSANVYTVENFDDYDTFSYTSYTCPYENGVVIEDKIYVQGYLHWDNGTIVTPIEDIVWPAVGAVTKTFPIAWVSEGGVCEKNIYRYVIQDNALIDPQYSQLSTPMGILGMFRNNTIYLGGNSGSAIGTIWTDSTAETSLGDNTGGSNKVSFDDMLITVTGTNAAQHKLVYIGEDGTKTSAYVSTSFSEDSPIQSWYGRRYAPFRNGNTIYLISGNVTYVSEWDVVNKTWTITYGYFNNSSLDVLNSVQRSVTKDSLFYLGGSTYWVPNITGEKEATYSVYNYPDTVTAELSNSSIKNIRTFYDKHVLFLGNNKAILCKYTNTPSDMEIVWTYTWDSSKYSITYINFSQTRQYLTIVHYDGIDYIYQIYIQDENNPYNYIAYKPEAFRFSPRTLSGFCTGNQGTDENGRRYVEVSTVLPEEESS